MRPILTLVSVLALVAPNASGTSALSLPGRGDSSSAAQHSSEVAAIEAYTKTLDRYFKRHPGQTRYYVDALPEGQSDESSGEALRWHEVKNEGEMLEAERGYATRSISVSTKDGEVVYADVGLPQEHSRRDDAYYFRADGTLAKISSDFYSNMAEVSIRRENFYGPGGRLLRQRTQCFTLTFSSRGSRERPASCRRYEMREELRDYKIPVYAKNTELPGYDTLRKP